MKQKPKIIKDLLAHPSDATDLLDFLTKHWEGLENVKPKGYDAFVKVSGGEYESMGIWENNEREKQENEFNGFNDGAYEVNFIERVALPYVAFDDICQGMSPIKTLIHACISYGFARGCIHGKDAGASTERTEIVMALNSMIVDRNAQSLRDKGR